ncbi:MAG: hypothetical protein PVF59_10550, partial [Desulfobacterales bacterium]
MATPAGAKAPRPCLKPKSTQSIAVSENVPKVIGVGIAFGIGIETAFSKCRKNRGVCAQPDADFNGFSTRAFWVRYAIPPQQTI